MGIMMTAISDEQILADLKDDIEAQIDAGYERLDLDRWMILSPWSRRQTERKFREHYLTSPARYFRDRQTERAGTLLEQGDDVLSASTKSGFASPGRLHDAMVVRYGLTPGEVRKKGDGVTINFGFFKTPIGIVLLAATKRGLCSVMLCGAEADKEELASRISELQATFPRANIEEVPSELQTVADQLVAFLTARSPEFCPPLDIIQGTTFQREVWMELQKLNLGETVSYSDIAERIGNPKAVRAVASAIGSNNLAIAIPCHRVVRKSGALAGYRWGLEWKKRLLELEVEIRAQDIV